MDQFSRLRPTVHPIGCYLNLGGQFVGVACGRGEFYLRQECGEAGRGLGHIGTGLAAARLDLQLAAGPFLVAEIAVRRMCSPETNFGDGSIDSDREAGGAVGAVAQLPLELRQRLTIGDHLKPGGQRLPGVMSSRQIVPGVRRLEDELWLWQIAPLVT